VSLGVWGLVAAGCSDFTRENPYDPDADNFQNLSPPDSALVIGDSLGIAVLTWQDSNSHEHGFNIYRGTDSLKVINLVGQVDSNVLIFTDTGLVPGSRYYYTIEVRGPTGESRVKGSIFSVTIPALPKPPSIPTAIDVFFTADNGFRVFWECDSGCTTDFILFRTDSGGNIDTLGTLRETIFLDTVGLRNNASYVYGVFGINADSISPVLFTDTVQTGLIVPGSPDSFTVFYFPFEDSAGSQINDFSDRNNHGVSSSDSFPKEGKFGKAIFLQAPDSIVQDSLSMAGDSFSLFFFFKPDLDLSGSVPDSIGFFTLGDSLQGFYSKGVFYLSTPDSTLIVDSLNFASNRWHSLECRFLPNRVEIIFNDEDLISFTEGVSPIVSPQSILVGGARILGNYYGFTGKIDEIWLKTIP